MDSIHAKLIKISKDTDYEFRYKHTSLYHLPQNLGFKYKKFDKPSVIMKNMEIVSWSYKYLLEIVKYRTQNYPIVYLDESWYDSHGTAKKMWYEFSKVSNLSAPVIKRKRVAICHVGRLEGFYR